ncbi:hypothetical protein, partial [Photobacterium kishitanii]|uniref:hypothetical protein n=1 Tax=Photobacterium kishitanii TaxID=318456 RepID=UPI000A5DB059
KSACWEFESLHPCHLQESLDSNVGAFLRLYHYDRAPTGRAAASAIPKISACWAFETCNPCHLQESLDSNVRIFYVCIIVIDRVWFQLAEQRIQRYRKSARVGSSNIVTPAIFKKASTEMSGLFYVCIIMIELQLAEQRIQRYRKSALVGHLKLRTPAIFKKASTAM